MPRYYRYKNRFERLERDVHTDVSRSLPAISDNNRLTRLERQEYLRSQDNKKWLNAPPWAVKDQPVAGPKVALKATALLEVQRRLSSFKEADFSNPQKRAAYRALRASEEGLKKSSAVKPAGADRRSFHPSGVSRGASTVTGNIARFARAGLGFAMPHFVIPCIQRHVRREVMFATGKAGKGYKVPHRRNEHSGVPC